MSEVLQTAALWLGLSVVAVFMFALGFTLGRRSGWEEGCRRGWHAARAGETTPPRLAPRRRLARSQVPDADTPEEG